MWNPVDSISYFYTKYFFYLPFNGLNLPLKHNCSLFIFLSKLIFLNIPFCPTLPLTLPKCVCSLCKYQSKTPSKHITMVTYTFTTFMLHFTVSKNTNELLKVNILSLAQHTKWMLNSVDYLNGAEHLQNLIFIFNIMNRYTYTKYT